MFKFSVLLSVYVKENPGFLKQALESVFNQTYRATEVVLVKDGTLTSELDGVIDSFIKTYPELVIVPLERNVGLGLALSEGLNKCSFPYVARMDTDDVCTNNRFEKQVGYMKSHPEIDVLGTDIYEFIDDVNQPVSKRTLPKNHDDIVNFAKKRNPVNHMTVFFKKQSVQDVGGYLPFHGFEDYYLWVRMLTKGMRFHNLKEPLVLARIGNDMIGRRIGLEYVKSEIRLFIKFHKLGFLSLQEFIIILPQRIGVRMMPKSVLSKLYSHFLRNS